MRPIVSLNREPDCQVCVTGNFECGGVLTGKTFPAVTQILSLLSFLSLVSLAWPLWRLWQTMGRTAMRFTCIWILAAAALWAVVLGLAGFEPSPGSWNWLGYFRLLSTGFLAAPIVSVLGARRPGEKAWNLIIVTLLIVFALPIFEQWLLGRPMEVGRVGMDGPRASFFLIIVAVGFVNYVLTRFGIASMFFVLSLAMQVTAIGPWNSGDAAARGVYFAAAGLMASASAWIAYLSRYKENPSDLATRWGLLRDGWGLVWSARIRDRWNASARRYGWPVQLTWIGPKTVTSGVAPTPEQIVAAENEFKLLVRRFFELAPHESWNDLNAEGTAPNVQPELR